MTISIASLEIAVIPILLKYINVPIINYLAKGFEIVFALIIVYLVVKINSFYFKRKEELLFSNFVLNRINNLKTSLTTDTENRTINKVKISLF